MMLIKGVILMKNIIIGLVLVSGLAQADVTTIRSGTFIGKPEITRLNSGQCIETSHELRALKTFKDRDGNSMFSVPEVSSTSKTIKCPENIGLNADAHQNN
jgi:hypothetical protein